MICIVLTGYLYARPGTTVAITHTMRNANLHSQIGAMGIIHELPPLLEASQDRTLEVSQEQESTATLATAERTISSDLAQTKRNKVVVDTSKLSEKEANVQAICSTIKRPTFPLPYSSSNPPDYPQPDALRSRVEKCF